MTLLIASALLAAATAAEGPGVPTPIEGAELLAPWFDALDAAARGEGVARALHYGDSTLAADGLASTVRDRLQARLGDAGPGFVPASFLPMWSVRKDVAARRSGEWTYRTILYGGAGGRYGLGGIVAVLRGGHGLGIRAVDGEGSTRRMQRAEAWVQAGVGYGSLALSLDGEEVARHEAVAAQTEDRVHVVERAEGFEELRLLVSGGPVPLYGVVLETGRPGATWETLAVSGVGSKSFTIYAGEELAEQVARRDPDLVVIMLGGNEAGYPVLTVGDGSGYAPIFQGAVDVIRAGAPDAACLVVSPLDQGEQVEVDGQPTGERRSKRGMPNLVAQQRAVAQASGCAFWSAWEAMGGEGASVTWTRHRGLTTGDLVHLTSRGLEVIGELLADALLQAYDAR